MWLVGLCGSVLANAAIISVLTVAMRPEPVEQQQTPQSKLDVRAYQLDQDHAPAQRPEPTVANAAKPDSTAMSPGQVPQSQAIAKTPDAARLSARAPAKDRLAAAAPVSAATTPAKAKAASLTEVNSPIAKVLSRPAPTHAIALAQPRAAQAALSDMPKNTLLPASRKSPIALDSSSQTAIPVAQASGKSEALPQSAPSTQKANAAPTEILRMDAALAFSGGGDREIDPASLAAFQSFVRPGDVPAEGDQVRDAVSNLLAQVPCSRLQVAFDPATSTLQVKGHIPDGGLRTPVLAELQAQMGADIRVSDNILILPRPQCGALSGISNVGLPQSTDQITNPLLIGEDTHVRELGFVRGDRLYFDLTAPDYDAYVYVDYFDADGNVLHLSPNEQVSQRLTPAFSSLRVGSETASEDGLQIYIGPPYGQEITVAFAASAPLYEGLRPLVEPAAAYLDWLKSRVAAARANDPDFKGEWVYFFVRTSES